MSAVTESLNAAKLATFAAAVVVGASISAMVSGSQYAIPAVGTVPGLVVGGVGLVAGGGLYYSVKRFSASGCGCGGDCDC